VWVKKLYFGANKGLPTPAHFKICYIYPYGRALQKMKNIAFLGFSKQNSPWPHTKLELSMFSVAIKLREDQIHL
jgi:hypothetical protein